MKLLVVVFTAGNGASYTYTYNGDEPVEVGDYAIANNALTQVTGVIEPEDYVAPANGQLAIPNLKEIKYVVSRAAERAELKRRTRIAEIKEALYGLKRKHEERTELEETASVSGAEGKKLLAELKELEG